MDYDRYSEIIKANTDRAFPIILTALDVGIIHGAIRLLLMHPEVETNYSQVFKERATHWRQQMLTFFREMGFTEQELEEIDNQLA